MLAFGASWFLSGQARRLLLKRHILDRPGARSSHFEPTPRGGGIAFIAVFLAATLCYFLVNVADWSLFKPFLLCLFAGGGLITGLGFVDDCYSINPFVKLLLHSLLALSVLLLLAVPSLSFATVVVHDSWLVGILASIALVWCINFFNFMDGTDGIAILQAMTMSLSALAISLLLGGSQLHHFIFASLFAAALGFCFWNFPPAKLFMGDTGSGFLGYILALLAMETSTHGVLNVWCWLILFGVFVADATTTLVLRLKNRQKITQAHRDHAYQRLAMYWQASNEADVDPAKGRARAHRRVLLGVLLINTVWFFPLAFAAATFPEWGFALAILAFIPLVFLVLKVDKHSRSSWPDPLVG